VGDGWELLGAVGGGTATEPSEVRPQTTPLGLQLARKRSATGRQLVELAVEIGHGRSERIAVGLDPSSFGAEDGVLLPEWIDTTGHGKDLAGTSDVLRPRHRSEPDSIGILARAV